MLLHDLNDVNLIEPGWQLALAGVSGPLTLEGGVLDTRGLRGQLNGGDFFVEGAVPIRAGAVAPRPLNVEARGLFVEVPKGLRSQLDTRLTWNDASRHSCPVRSPSPRTAIGNRSPRWPRRLPRSRQAAGRGCRWPPGLRLPP